MDLTTHIESTTTNKSLFQSVKGKILYLFRLTNRRVVKVYHGFGNQTHLILYGHVLNLSPLPRKKYKKNFWTNTLALLRSFMIRPVADATVSVMWNGQSIETKTAKDGFFRLDWDTKEVIKPGLYYVQVNLLAENDKNHIIASAKGSVIVPHINQYAFISDIDDTFLVSHSATFLRKLYVLFTKNAHSRKPFEDVVKHYRLLSHAGDAEKETPNPFFFVSSSEWNLYDFIKEFCRKNGLPDGVYLLSQIKKLHQVFKSGANKHATKFMRIVRVMEVFPHQKFILLGDDSQQDPEIYAAIVEHFPNRVFCVYLRHVYEKNISNVKELIERMQNAGVHVCHFEHSKEAIEHSFKIGLLGESELTVYPT